VKEKRTPGGRNGLGICPSLRGICTLVLYWEPPLDYKNAREADEDSHITHRINMLERKKELRQALQKAAGQCGKERFPGVHSNRVLYSNEIKISP
jgi:hypothetical protein